MPNPTRQETLAQQIERVLGEHLHCSGAHCFHADRSFKGLIAKLVAIVHATGPPTTPSWCEHCIYLDGAWQGRFPLTPLAIGCPLPSWVSVCPICAAPRPAEGA